MAPSLKGLRVTDVPKYSDLPYSETTAILSTLSGHCHLKLEDLVRNTIGASKSKGPTPEFPASRLKKILDHYLQDSIRPQERVAVRTQLSRWRNTRRTPGLWRPVPLSTPRLTHAHAARNVARLPLGSRAASPTLGALPRPPPSALWTRRRLRQIS